MAKSKLKYHNKPCAVGPEKYRSERERDRHQELLLLQRAGHIAGLVREVAFELAPKMKIEGEARARQAARYFADFVYSDVANGKIVVAGATTVGASYTSGAHNFALVRYLP